MGNLKTTIYIGLPVKNASKNAKSGGEMSEMQSILMYLI